MEAVMICDQMEVREISANSGTGGELKTDSAGVRVENESSGARQVKEQKEKSSDCVVDIDDLNCRSKDEVGEKICRICLFGKEPSTGSSELISLGCNCKAGLGISHQYCAQTWFTYKGNRSCEICGEIAKNVHDIEENPISRADWDETRLTVTSLSQSRQTSYMCSRFLFNFLLVFLSLAFILPWFLRVDIF